MIQVKEFNDTDTSRAEQKANEFLSKLEENQIVSVQYSTGYKTGNQFSDQRSHILVVYRKE